MLIEILQESDIGKVEDTALKSYLTYSLERLPEEFDYFNHVQEYGCFVIVTEFEDLIEGCVQLEYFQLPSMDSPSFFKQIELVETKIINGVEIIEILVHVDTDITVSLIFRLELLDVELQGKVKEFLYE